MRRLLTSAGVLALLAVLVLPSTTYAQEQAFSFHVGGFVPRGEDSRDLDDVLFNNLDFLAFNIKDFSGATVGGEWLIGLNDFVDVGLGAGFYSKSVPAVYYDYTNGGAEIEQDLKLRTAPLTATIRFLPLGHHDAFVPYVGAGVGVIHWRYRETGDFVDFSDRTVFRDTFTGSGWATGPVILGGARFPLSRGLDLGGEVRYQRASGDLPASEDFAGSTIDLGGFSYLATFTVKF